MGAFSWTDEAVAMLKDLVGKGVAYSLIGEALGCGRNAAIGKAHRLGLTGKVYERPRNNPGPRPARPKPERREPYRPKLSRAAVDPGELVSIVPLEEVKEVALEEVRPISLFDLKVTSCRFPMWKHGERPDDGGTYCGRRSLDGQPFCREHYRMVYVPIPRRVPKNPGGSQFDRDPRQRRFGAARV